MSVKEGGDQSRGGRAEEREVGIDMIKIHYETQYHV